MQGNMWNIVKEVPKAPDSCLPLPLPSPHAHTILLTHGHSSSIMGFTFYEEFPVCSLPGVGGSPLGTAEAEANCRLTKNEQWRWIRSRQF